MSKCQVYTSIKAVSYRSRNPNCRSRKKNPAERANINILCTEPQDTAEMFHQLFSPISTTHSF